MQKEYLIELGDAVVAVKRPDGSVKLNQLVEPVKSGAVSGMFWGALIGLLFMMPLAGAAVGAASGALSGKFTDLGDQQRIHEGCRAGPAIRQRRIVSPYTENDDR